MPSPSDNRSRQRDTSLRKVRDWSGPFATASGPEAVAKGPDQSRTLRRLVSLCRDLLSEGDGISNAARATDAIRLYETLDRPGRIAFFDILIRDFSPNPDDLVRAADEYRQDPSPANLRRLQEMVEPPRQELFRRLNMA